MLNLPLQPTDEHANPAFRDATTCAQWLGQLQLTNLHQAHGVLRAQLDELNRFPMNGLERMHTLELLRETVSSIQGDYAKKLAGKRLPFSQEEFAVFAAIVSLWQGMVTGYRRCLQSWLDGETQLAPYGPLLCQRCLACSGLQISEHLRNGYEFDGKLWRQMHALYAFCEERGWQLAEVSDDSGNTSCSATYVKTLLACHAHRADLPRQQLLMMDQWLTQWSPLVTIERKYVASKGDAPPLAVDLDSMLGLQLPQLAAPSEHMRYLGMVPLSKLIRVKNILLLQGQSPQQLELGDACDGKECSAFLSYLHQCWCEGQDNRTTERHEEAQQATVCYGLDSCFSYIANRPFKQPGKTGVDTMARKQIAAFGYVVKENKQQDLAEMGFVHETWRLEDESIRGARMLREVDTGVRLGPHLLVAVRPADAQGGFMAGVVSWIKVTQEGRLRAGVRYLPGLPQAVSMKATGVNLTVSEKYVAALLLPETPALKTPASLLIPRDWFKPGRVVEILYEDRRRQLLKMELSIEKGFDYERIGFSELKQ